METELLAGCGGESCCPAIRAIKDDKKHLLVTGRMVESGHDGPGEVTVEVPTETLHQAAAELLRRGV